MNNGHKYIIAFRLVLPVMAACALVGIACEKTGAGPAGNGGTGNDRSFTESFTHWDSTLARGWIPLNNSVPAGSGTWAAGGGSPSWFSGFGVNTPGSGFVGVTTLSTSAGKGLVSNWLISPVVKWRNGDKIIFYTRCLLVDQGNGDSLDFGNSLELCVNWFNDSTNVGIATDPRERAYTEWRDHGDFMPVLKINPPLYNPFSNRYEYRLAHSNNNLNDPLAYPTSWTRFEATISGLNYSVYGRFAFRYYVPDGGSSGNGSGIAIDEVQYISAH